MSVPTIAITINLYDGTGVPITSGSAVFTPTTPVTIGLQEFGAVPVTVPLSPAGLPVANLIPTDTAGESPASWAWQVAFPNVPGSFPAFSFSLPAGPVAFTAASGTPGVLTWTATSTFTALPNGTGVQLTGGSLPAGVTAGTTYYVTGASGQTIRLAATPGGSAIALTSSGSGSVSVISYLLSGLAPVSVAQNYSGFLPLPGGTAGAGMVPVATGSGSATTWQTVSGGGGGAVSTVFGRAGAVAAASGDYTVSQVTGAAPLASPALTGTPTAPTQAGGDNSTKVATTAFTASSVATETTRAQAAETLLAPKASPALTGTPTAPTQAPGDNSTRIATTAFVAAAGGGGVTSVFTRSGVVAAASGDYTVSQVTGAAPLASPALTGTPSAPTAAALTSTTQLATTAYADSAVGVEATRALAAEALKAPLASPALTGTPTAPTQSPGDNSTRIATTAFVAAAGGGGVTTVFGRAGVVAATSGDYAVAQVTGAAPLASPALTGTPTAPTAAGGTSTTQLATTAFTGSAVTTETTRAQAAEALLAPKASPALTGTPTAPTATALTNTTQVATTAYADAAVTVERTRGQAAEVLLIPLAQRGAASGVATLDSGTHIPAAQLPAATTAAQGAVTLDGTAGDIAALASSGAAGAIGKAADAGHVHPATGLVRATGGGLETVSTIASATGATPLNLANGNVFNVTLTGNVTLSFTGATAGVSCAFSAYLTQDATGGRTVTWPGGITWLSGTTPAVLSTAGAVSLFAFESLDGGTTWFGSAVTGPSLPLSLSQGGTGQNAASNAALLTALGAAPSVSPALTGTPTAPTATALTSTTQVATTAYADAAVAAEATRALAAEALRAPLASPALTGAPTAPTATALTGGTRIATAAYADAAVAVETTRAQAAEALVAYFTRVFAA